MDTDVLKDMLSLVDRRLKEKINMVDKQEIKKILSSEVGCIKELKKLSPKEMDRILCSSGIIGVDGSINNYGGIYPHYISLIRALAKSTQRDEEDIFFDDVYVPFIEARDSEDDDEKRRRSHMSAMEISAASAAIDRMKSRVILMDGSLMHYSIDCPTEWKEFKQKAIESGKIVIGVTEEIKTRDIIEAVKTIVDISDDMLYDREIIFGMLKVGEMLEFRFGLTKKMDSGIKTCYVRMSEDPQAVGLDFLEEQYDEGIKYADVVYTLTPLKSRGIPLWLDIVDKEVKVTHEMVTALVERCISREVREELLNPKRSKRF